jgi:hypothetical protein
VFFQLSQSHIPGPDPFELVPQRAGLARLVLNRPAAALVILCMVPAGQSRPL